MENDLSGRRLGGRYALDAHRASGGMAAVWEARDEVLGRRVAIKVLHPQLTQDPEVFDRFRLEAVAAARLSHPCVVRVFDTGVDEDLCFIVMELLEGPNLAELIAEESPMPAGRAMGIAREILDGLAHAHEIGVVHRDVKPSNVLTDTAGHVKVTDFGIAKAAFAGGDLTTTGKLLGTARYLAPEQVQEMGGVDPRADLYATGLVIYEMLTGRVPFEAETDLATATMRLTQEPRPPGALRAGIPREVDELVMRALRRERGERFSDARQMRAAVDRLGTGGSTAAIPAIDAAEPERPKTRRRQASFFRSWILVPFMLALAVAAIVGGAMFVQRSRNGTGAGEAAGTGPIEIRRATDHDPGGDGREHSEDTPLAIDGDRSTFWRTERYNTDNLGGIKSGVGLILDLGETREIRSIEFATTLPGWEFEIHGSDDGSTFLEPLPDRDEETSFIAEESTRVRLQPVEFRYMRLWITRLAVSDDGFRATVAEVEVAGR